MCCWAKFTVEDPLVTAQPLFQVQSFKLITEWHIIVIWSTVSIYQSVSPSRTVQKNRNHAAFVCILIVISASTALPPSFPHTHRHTPLTAMIKQYNLILAFLIYQTVVLALWVSVRALRAGWAMPVSAPRATRPVWTARAWVEPTIVVCRWGYNATLHVR